MAAAVPNIAARHQRGPRSARTMAAAMAAQQAAPVMIHCNSDGVSVPYSGLAKYRKPASPRVTASDPSSSRRVIANPNQRARITTRNTSSVVRIGWTWDSRPKCRATACSRNETIIRANPSSQIRRRSAKTSRLSRSVESAGARSTPMRWNTLVRALASAAPRASTKTINPRLTQPCPALAQTHVSYKVALRRALDRIDTSQPGGLAGFLAQEPLEGLAGRVAGKVGTELHDPWHLVVGQSGAA